jgi:hypothetical protein
MTSVSAEAGVRIAGLVPAAVPPECSNVWNWLQALYLAMIPRTGVTVFRTVQGGYSLLHRGNLIGSIMLNALPPSPSFTPPFGICTSV